MKCPFRKITTRSQSKQQYCFPVHIAEEDFGECYKADCPYYIADEQDTTKFRCARCNNAE